MAENYEKIPYASTMTNKELSELRKKTAKFLEKDMADKGVSTLSGTDRFYNSYLTQVPYDLLTLPDFQEERVRTNAAHVGDILGHIDTENKATPAVVCYMSEGKYKGVFVIVDGHHVTTAMMIANPDKAMPCFILKRSESEAIQLFSQQHQGKKNLNPKVKMLARLDNEDKHADNLTYADNFIVTWFKDTFNMDFIEEKMPIVEFEMLMVDNLYSSEPKLLPHAEDALKWVSKVYINSCIYTASGQQAYIVNAIGKIFKLWTKGCFGDLSEANLTAACVNALRNECAGSIKTKICAIMQRNANGMLYAAPSDCRTSVTEWLRYNVCMSAGFDWHLTSHVANDRKITQRVVANGFQSQVGCIPPEKKDKTEKKGKKK